MKAVDGSGMGATRSGEGVRDTVVVPFPGWVTVLPTSLRSLAFNGGTETVGLVVVGETAGGVGTICCGNGVTGGVLVVTTVPVVGFLEVEVLTLVVFLVVVVVFVVLDRVEHASDAWGKANGTTRATAHTHDRRTPRRHAWPRVVFIVDPLLLGTACDPIRVVAWETDRSRGQSIPLPLPPVEPKLFPTRRMEPPPREPDSLDAPLDGDPFRDLPSDW